jgi:DNA replication protein DnaC
MDDAADRPEIIPQAVRKAESGVYELLKSRGLVLPCPFETRLEAGERHRQLVDLIRRLGFRYQESTLENFEVYHPRQTEVVGRLARFAESMPEHLRGGGGLMLFGDPGTGKDHLLAAILKLAVVVHGLSVLWFDGGELYDRFHMALQSEGDVDWKKLSDELRKPHVLAISDPQPPQGALSAPQVRRLRDIIDKRYRAGKSTWLTTNIDQREYAEQLFTKPVMERIKEASATILCDWPSYRGRRKAGW